MWNSLNYLPYISQMTAEELPSSLTLHEFVAPHMAPPPHAASSSGICRQLLPDVLSYEHAGKFTAAFCKLKQAATTRD